MINEWKQYLQQTGARFDENDHVIHFDHTAAGMNDTILVDLSHLQLIQVSGRDALKFLQSQFTNDVRQVDASHSQLNAWCNPKGRVIATFRLFQRQDVYYMVFPRSMATTVLERLRKYVLRAEVNIEIVHDLLCVGIAGKQSIPVLSQCLRLTLAAVPHHMVVTAAVTTVITITESPPRFLVISDWTTLKGLWECAKTIVYPEKTATWHLLDILSGIPQVVPVTTEMFVPQMINWHMLGGVNFKKGCYPGQEIVARMQYLATQKRQMFLLKAINATVVPRPGDMLYADLEAQQDIGTIVNAEVLPEGGYAALAVLPAELNMATIQDTQGNELRVIDFFQQLHPVMN